MIFLPTLKGGKSFLFVYGCLKTGFRRLGCNAFSVKPSQKRVIITTYKIKLLIYIDANPLRYMIVFSLYIHDDRQHIFCLFNLSHSVPLLEGHDVLSDSIKKPLYYLLHFIHQLYRRQHLRLAYHNNTG